MRYPPLLLASLATSSLAGPASAQLAWEAGARAVPVLSRADPVPGDSALTELVVSQPVAWVSVAGLGGRLLLHAMLNAEGLTMRNGQLATGVWGEGFSDRRHPHTWGHEIVVALTDPVRLPAGGRWSLAAGKGFAPFGSDDPMGRPALLFPVNHHLAQITERALLVLSLGGGPATLEVGIFNGDEPERPGQWPAWSRFGDSFSSRLTVRPGGGVELQASVARVKSPEHRPGAGLDHLMRSFSARLERGFGAGELYLMAEAARTEEEGVFRFGSALVEAQLAAGRHRSYARFERTDRPEEPRVFGDPFRSVRPHHENANLGITRWTTALAGHGVRLTSQRAPLRAEALAEVAWAHVSVVTGATLSPRGFYGRNDLVLLSAGVRVGAGQPLHRMGRYGLLAHGPAGHEDHGN